MTDQPSFRQALHDAQRQLMRLRERADELGRELEANQAETLRYKGVVMALEQLMGSSSKGGEEERANTPDSLRDLLDLQRRLGEPPTQTSQIVRLLRRYPMGLERPELERVIERAGVVTDVRDMKAAINSALWRAVKSGHIEKDGDTYRLPATDASPSRGLRATRDGGRASGRYNARGHRLRSEDDDA